MISIFICFVIALCRNLLTEAFNLIVYTYLFYIKQFYTEAISNLINKSNDISLVLQRFIHSGYKFIPLIINIGMLILGESFWFMMKFLKFAILVIYSTWEAIFNTFVDAYHEIYNERYIFHYKMSVNKIKIRVCTVATIFTFLIMYISDIYFFDYLTRIYNIALMFIIIYSILRAVRSLKNKRNHK